MLNDKHEIGGRIVEIREGDGNKPADSFLGKAESSNESNNRGRERKRKSRSRSRDRH